MTRNHGKRYLRPGNVPVAVPPHCLLDASAPRRRDAWHELEHGFLDQDGRPPCPKVSGPLKLPLTHGLVQIGIAQIIVCTSLVQQMPDSVRNTYPVFVTEGCNLIDEIGQHLGIDIVEEHGLHLKERLARAQRDERVNIVSPHLHRRYVVSRVVCLRVVPGVCSTVDSRGHGLLLPPMALQVGRVDMAAIKGLGWRIEGL